MIDQGELRSDECEQAVLAACLLDARWLREMVLPVEAFSSSVHQAIYRSMLELDEDGQSVDVLTVADRLRAAGALEQCGGLAYLSGLDTLLPDITGTGQYAEILVELLRRRRVVGIASKLAVAARDRSRPLVDSIARAEGDLVEVSTTASSGEWLEAGSQIQDIARYAVSAEANSNPGVSVGLPGVDRQTGGMQPGEQWVFGARPGHGKSALMKQMAFHQAADMRVPVGILSLEMTTRSLLARVLAQVSRVAPQRFMSGEANRAERQAVEEAASTMRSMPLFVNDRVSPNLPQLLAAARQLVVRERCRVLYVDHVQRVRVGRGGSNRHLEVGEISGAFAALAKELGITTVLLSQLSRPPEGNEWADPTLSRLRESGDLEADAHVVLLLHRPEKASFQRAEKEGLRGVAKVIIAKNREGETGYIEARFHGPTTTFREEAKR